MPPYGQFGTGTYPQQTIPGKIVKQYPGAQNFRSALGMFGDLAYGPLSGGLSDIAAAQAMDPAAQAFQQETEGGQGIYSPPGAASGAMGNLFGSAAGAEATRQSVKNQQVNEALKGMAATGAGLAQSIYEQQSAANKLDAAQIEAQQQQEKGILDIANQLTSPSGMGSNIVSLFGGPSGTSPLGYAFGTQGAAGGGGLFSGWGSGGAGGGVAALGAEGDILPSDILAGGSAMGGAGVTSGGLMDLGSIFGSLGGAGAGAGGGLTYLADLAPFFAGA